MPNAHKQLPFVDLKPVQIDTTFWQARPVSWFYRIKLSIDKASKSLAELTQLTTDYEMVAGIPLI
jgi:hypothetical protein